MKKLFIIMMVILSFAITSKSQSIFNDSRTKMDTIINVSTKDTVIKHKSSILINPIVVNYQGDLAYSINWSLNTISRDTTQDAYAYIQLFNNKGVVIINYSIQIPKEIVNGNSFIIGTIDDYIFSLNKRYVKK